MKKGLKIIEGKEKQIIYIFKFFVFDTKPLKLKLRGFSWIFKSINLCYNQCVENIKNHEFSDDERRAYLHREVDFINKYKHP